MIASPICCCKVSSQSLRAALARTVQWEVTDSSTRETGETELALMLQAESGAEIFKLGLIWVLVLAASATVCFLIGNEAYRRGQKPWTRGTP